MLIVALPIWSTAQEVTTFMFDGGIQGGYNYIIGDGNVQSAAIAGPFIRYKFDRHWAVRAQIQQQVTPKYEWANADISVEYNFFRYGVDPYDKRVKAISPFIAIGFGFTSNVKKEPIFCVTDKQMKFDLGNCLSTLERVYIPIGIGLKWKFADKWQLQALWQHQIYLLKDDLDNKGWHGSATNIMNNDVFSTFTVGISVDFFRLRYKRTFYPQ